MDTSLEPAKQRDSTDTQKQVDFHPQPDSRSAHSSHQEGSKKPTPLNLLSEHPEADVSNLGLLNEVSYLAAAQQVEALVNLENSLALACGGSGPLNFFPPAALNVTAPVV